jgi:tetratricopeptide (TPR) repeat protein/tRNA A-37 threonylcarbamoyl transferase component Bud32
VLSTQPYQATSDQVGLHSTKAMLNQLLGGRYLILQPLGGGGFGQTFLARDQHLPGKPTCVVKQLKPKVTRPAAWEMAKRLFEAEAEVLHILGHHDQIPRLTAHFEENQEFYLVQEYIEGKVLSQEFRDRAPLPEGEVRSLIQEILTLLVFVHQYQVVHRDIKPGNLIRRAIDGKIVLIDFGAVKQMALHASSDPALVIGSSGYAPPEQLSGASGFESDLYAVGMIGIQALTNCSPKHFQRDPQTQALFWRDQAEVSPEFADFLDELIHYDPQQRYGVAKEALELLGNLRPITQDEPIEEPGQAWRERGDYLLQRQHYREAIAAYDRALHLQPQDPELWLQKGIALDGFQDFTAALSCYEQVIAFKADSIQAWLKRGVLLENLCEWQAALDCYDRAVQLQPDNYWAWYDRGKLLETLARPQDAIVAYDRAIQIKPKFQLAVESCKRLLVQHRQIEALMLQGHYAEVITLLDAQRLEDGSSTASNFLSSSLAANSLRRNASGDRLLLGLSPQHQLTYSIALARLKQYDTALECLDVLLVAHPEQGLVYLEQAWIFRQQANFTAALEASDRAVELLPDRAIAWHGRAKALEKLQSYESALLSYHRALELQPDLAAAKEGRARMLKHLSPTLPKLAEELDDSTILSALHHPAKANPSEAASATCQSAEATDAMALSSIPTSTTQATQNLAPQNLAPQNLAPQNLTSQNIVSTLAAAQASSKFSTSPAQNQAGSWLLKGRLLEKMHNHQAAIAAYNQAMKLSPDDPEVLRQRGNVLFALGRYEEAISTYDRAIHNQPDNPVLWNSLASALMKLKRYREAIACFDRVIHLKPENPVPWYWRGKILWILKKYESAIQSMDAALARKPNFEPALRDRRDMLQIQAKATLQATIAETAGRTIGNSNC